MDLNKKIAEIIKAKDISKTELARQWGFSKQYIINIVSGRGSTGMEVVNNLISSFPDLNMNWLLKDEGEMFIDNPGSKDELIKSKEETIKDLRKYIARLEKDIDRLEKDLEEHYTICKREFPDDPPG
jgi:transcriptional regulator with XRE-family HTH domain